LIRPGIREDFKTKETGMIFNSGAEYALKAMIYMARHPQTEYFGVKELAEKLELSQSYLAKILQLLSKKNYLKSVTGPGGGFGLADNTLSERCEEIVNLLSDRDFTDKCVFGLSECGNENPCIFHETWAPHREKIVDLVRNGTIGELAEISWPLFTDDRHLL
jgi:Rrf2 family transcriptional regulator, iron-sulfur cluster assembly transcription factor